MRFAAFLVLIVATAAFAQNPPALAAHPEPESATVPLTIDHNRIVINVTLLLPDASTTRVRGWVDNGNPDLHLSRRVATLLGLALTCDDQACSAPPPHEVTIGGMKISFAGVKEAKIPLKPVAAAAVMAPGMSAEINIPSTVLRHYDVLINFPDREFTIARPGSLKFKGVTGKMLINSNNGLIQIPSQLGNKNYNLGLDLGSSISFLSQALFDKLASTHPDWPHMTGAIGPANLWGSPDEPKRELLRLDRLQYGPLYLNGVPFVDFPKEAMTSFKNRGAISTVGWLGTEALLNYRIGLDYAHATVYFDIGRLSTFPDFDVVGLILRPEDDGRFTILGIADYDGKPSVQEVQTGDQLIAVDGIPVANFTLGLVWSLLLGGQEHNLTMERDGKQLTVAAKVQHFLGHALEENHTGKGPGKKE
jgi:hypothetical protein